jgi:hypothetical protein
MLVLDPRFFSCHPTPNHVLFLVTETMFQFVLHLMCMFILLLLMVFFFHESIDVQRISHVQGQVSGGDFVPTTPAPVSGARASPVPDLERIPEPTTTAGAAFKDSTIPPCIPRVRFACMPTRVIARTTHGSSDGSRILCVVGLYCDARVASN